MPVTTPQIKVDAVRARGANVVLHGDSYSDAYEKARTLEQAKGLAFVDPYDDPEVIAGQGTIAIEILRHHTQPIHAVFVPIGGGGLISGIAVAAEASAPTSVIGVEVEASAPFTHSIEAGRIVEIDVKPTLADGLAGNLDPDTPTFDIVRRLVRRIHVVSEFHLEEAIRGIAGEERLIVEAAGAAGVAALVAGRIEARGRNVAVVLSGANIDLKTFRKIV
jgi:threonine dehydratase